jgi:hypothetical protein
MKGFFQVALILAALMGGCTPAKNTHETSHQNLTEQNTLTNDDDLINKWATCQTCNGDGFVQQWSVCRASDFDHLLGLTFFCEGGNWVGYKIDDFNFKELQGTSVVYGTGRLFGKCKYCGGRGEVSRRVICPNNRCKNGQVLSPVESPH